LAITLGVEVPIYVVVLCFAQLLPGWRRLAAAVGVNLVTHPVVWLVLSARPAWFPGAEAGACLVEAGLLWLLVRRDGPLLLATSVAANTASVLAGIVLNGLL
jgi:hypothetical protein